MALVHSDGAKRALGLLVIVPKRAECNMIGSGVSYIRPTPLRLQRTA